MARVSTVVCDKCGDEMRHCGSQTLDIVVDLDKLDQHVVECLDYDYVDDSGTELDVCPKCLVISILKDTTMHRELGIDCSVMIKKRG